MCVCVCVCVCVCGVCVEATDINALLDTLVGEARVKVMPCARGRERDGCIIAIGCIGRVMRALSVSDKVDGFRATCEEQRETVLCFPRCREWV